MRILGCVCIASVVLLGVPLALVAADPTLEEITRALREWKSSWVNLRIHYERRNPEQLRKYTTDPKIRQAESLEDYFFRTQWILTDQGIWRKDEWRVEAGTELAHWSIVQNPRKKIAFHAQANVRPDGSTTLVSLTLSTPQARSKDPEDSSRPFLGFAAAHPLYGLFTPDLQLQGLAGR